MKSELDGIFTKIESDLDSLDEKREKILPISRNIIRNCSKIIKQIHRGEFENIEDYINKTRALIDEGNSLSQSLKDKIGKNYLITAKQEFTEAATFYSYITKNRIPSFSELGVNAYEYIMGLADLVGEIKRKVLNLIRADDIEKAEHYFEFMEELYQFLFSLDYADGLIPGFRKKVDVCRKIVQNTLDIIILSKNTSILNKNLKKVLEDNDFNK